MSHTFVEYHIIPKFNINFTYLFIFIALSGLWISSISASVHFIDNFIKLLFIHNKLADFTISPFAATFFPMSRPTFTNCIILLVLAINTTWINSIPSQVSLSRRSLIVNINITLNIIVLINWLLLFISLVCPGWCWRFSIFFKANVLFGLSVTLFFTMKWPCTVIMRELTLSTVPWFGLGGLSVEIWLCLFFH